MALVVSATWVARPGSEDEVAAALRELSPASREEPGCRFYQAHVDPEHPTVFRIFEIYDDDDAFTAHKESAHFATHGAGRAVPLLAEQSVELSHTLD